MSIFWQSSDNDPRDSGDDTYTVSLVIACAALAGTAIIVGGVLYWVTWLSAVIGR